MVAAMLMAVAACTSSDEITDGDTGNQQQAPATVGFDAYLQRSTRSDNTTTRSGATGTLTTSGDNATTSLQEKGFGVLAYNTGDQFYSERAIADFMYNEHVSYDGMAMEWTYNPAKYWPNGEGEATGVTGAVPYYVSFFAYAPWVNVTESTGLVATGGGNDEYSGTTGITALTRNVKTGDPMVRYDVVLDPAKRVDLCWAQPQLNLKKPEGTVTADDARINMQFRHALAAINIQIDSDIRQNLPTPNTQHDKTRIWLRSVILEGMTFKGWLNLNHSGTQPQWYSIDGYVSPSVKPVTVYDGRRDTREAILDDVNETPTGLNTNLIQTESYTINPTTDDIETPTTSKGVTQTTVNLFGHDNNGTRKALPVYVIPTGAPLRVTVVYDVETYDAKLASNHLSDGCTPGSTIENNITAAIISSGSPVTMQAGKTYALKLHLGLRSVEATATVSEWQMTEKDIIFDSENEIITLDVSIINNFEQGGKDVDITVELP
jgi:hypothetical protein